MTEEERKLLQLVAKASGIELLGQCDERSYIREITDGMMIGWNPIIDDGDALRLAVKLNFTIAFDSLSDGPVVKVFASWNEEFIGYSWMEWLNNDSACATRRAIVRAAASIGEAMTTEGTKCD